ncbi:MAG: DNA-3-methyladenine glycosylase I [Crocinitomicaceae bacterium]
MSSKPTVRCEWSTKTNHEQEYHDTEWGVPVHDDRLLFETIILEGAQAGLSWSTVLAKRDGYKAAFDNFDVVKVSQYTEAKAILLKEDSGIIRNRLKISATIGNAKAFIAIQKEFGSFDKYIWSFVNHKPILNKYQSVEDVPVSTKESDAMSKDLKKRGFKFVGTTICYAYMQAIGMVNDHTVDCFRHQDIEKLTINN